MSLLLVGGVVTLSLCLLCMVPTGMWVGFQLTTYDQCLNAIEEATAKSTEVYLNQSTRENFDAIWADIVTGYHETEAVVVLSMYENIDVIYRTMRYTEFVLFTCEFTHPECSGSVAMKYVPFEYPLYNDLRLLWIRAADQVQELRTEIESVRFVQADQVMYEKKLDKLTDAYEIILPKFSSLMYTVDQLSKTDVAFQNKLRTFPYNWLSSVVPRLELCFASRIMKGIKKCNDDLQTRPVYVLHLVEEEDFERLKQLQILQRAQQEQKNTNIALHAQ